MDQMTQTEWHLNSSLGLRKNLEKALSERPFYCQKILIENQGDKIVKDCLPILNHAPIYTLERLAECIAKEEHPLLALYQIWSQSLIQIEEKTPSTSDPLTLLNFIGGCSKEEYASHFVRLCHQLGIGTRSAGVQGKEAYDFCCQDDWTYLDPASGKLYLALDNRTAVSTEELIDDPFLALRTKTERKAAALNFQQAWEEFAHFDVINSCLNEQAVDTQEREAQTKAKGFTLYPQEKLVYYTPATRSTLKDYEREVDHHVHCDQRDFSLAWQYTSPFPLASIRNESSSPLMLKEQNVTLQPGASYAFQDSHLFSVTIEASSRPEGSVVVTSKCSWRLFPALTGEANTIELGEENDSQIKLTYEIDETVEGFLYPSVQVANDTGLFDFSSPCFLLAQNPDSPAEKIWWQISSDEEFKFVPFNFEQVVPFSAEITLPAISETFFNAGETYYFRVRGYGNEVWSDWSAPFAFAVNKPDPVGFVEFEKVEDNCYEINWEREAEENDGSIEYLIFGSNSLDFIPSIYSDKQVNELVDGKVAEEEINDNLIAITKEPKFYVDGSLAYYRIVAKQHGQFSVPSSLIRVYDQDLIQPRNVLQIVETEEGHQVAKRVLIPASYPWTETALPHVKPDNASFENSLLAFYSSLIRAETPFIDALTQIRAYTYNPHVTQSVWNKASAYFLPENHPIKPKLDRMFSATRVTKDPESFKKAGFKRYRPGRKSHIMASSHPELNHFFIKAFPDTDVMIKADWQKLIGRIEGARAVKASIASHGYKSMFKVPNKWLYPLPEHPSPPNNSRYLRKNFILVAENMRILENKKNDKAYKHKMTTQLLDAIYILINEVGLSDSVYAFNIPFCKDGKIAFIDTEDHHRWPIPWHKLGNYLSSDMQKHLERLVRNGGPKQAQQPQK
ncbi:hypothetical protein [Candidatus Protochlamydia phocaeensis]|uniref:hypothetical protein n=1 Tax=Candidatus Protochlamydia phocaeensis TaxID=1414722 RepID=UPI0012ABBC6A|nr:hypothetical protein [Candidatus Protochlamydia phocaeensis]